MLTWVDSIEKLEPIPDPVMQGWAAKPKILSTALQACFPEGWHLSCRSQGPATLLDEETLFLNLNSSKGWVRESGMCSLALPLTYGRVSMPLSTYENYSEALDNLGNKPIGQTLLYNDPTVTRGPFSFAWIMPIHPLFAILKSLDTTESFGFLARRSLFQSNHHPLMITEAFFCSLSNHPLSC